MKKVLVTFVVLAMSLAMVGTSSAEGKISVGVGADLVLPLDSGFKDAYSIGFGGTARGQYMINEQFSAMVTVGFITFSGKDVGGVTLDNATMIPILVGGKYFFTEGKMRWYGAADLGISSFKQSVSFPGTPAIVIGGITVFPGTPARTESATSSEFTFQPKSDRSHVVL